MISKIKEDKKKSPKSKKNNTDNTGYPHKGSPISGL